ncbi:MAG: HD domain-containing protein [Desulfovibrionaceae bacterium]|nr:HD domain-containing protein [Desulfovibrionaceae bacterium]
MPQRQTVHDLKANDELHSVFLIGAASLQQSRNGPYWRLELRDATGAVEAKIWSPLSASFTDLAAGQMADIRGRVGLFRDQLQVTVEALRPLTDDESDALNLADFMPASPRPAAEMLAEAEELCRKELTHAPWRSFALAVLHDSGIRARLLSAPAAKSVHHAYAGGLLEHTLSVAGLCLRMADHYPELDRQTLLVAALFHDIGKLEEMEGGLTTEYTDAGRLLGHILQGLAMLEPFLAASDVEPGLALHLRHLIASHHGELEFGSPRQPATAEAFVLHHADNVDAKVAQWRALFPNPAGEKTEQGTDARSAGAGKHSVPSAPPAGSLEWSPWQGTLNRSLCRPARTPAAPDPGGTGTAPGKGKPARKAARPRSRIRDESTDGITAGAEEKTPGPRPQNTEQLSF